MSFIHETQAELYKSFLKHFLSKLPRSIPCSILHNIQSRIYTEIWSAHIFHSQFLSHLVKVNSNNLDPEFYWQNEDVNQWVSKVRSALELQHSRSIFRDWQSFKVNMFSDKIQWKWVQLNFIIFDTLLTDVLPEAFICPVCHSSSLPLMKMTVSVIVLSLSHVTFTAQVNGSKASVPKTAPIVHQQSRYWEQVPTPLPLCRIKPKDQLPSWTPMVAAGTRRRPSGFHVLSRKQAVGIRPLRLLLPVDEISLSSCTVALAAAKFHCMMSTHSFHRQDL